MRGYDYNRRTVTVLTPATVPAVSLDEAKAFLSVDGDHDDLTIKAMIGAATEAAESYTGRTMRPTGLRLTLDGFPNSRGDALDRLGPGTHDVAISIFGAQDVELPSGPVTAVSEIRTFGHDGASTVFASASWYLDAAGERVVLDQGATWPIGLRARAAVQIDYTAGYATLPEAVRLAILQHVAAMYDCREACEAPAACRAALDGIRRLDLLSW